MRTLILSDIHLGSRHCNVDLLNRVLDEERFDRLILNGDTLNNVNLRKLTPRHWAVLDRFRKFGRSRELILIRGNHDHEIDYHLDRGGERLNSGQVLPNLLEVPMLEEHELEIGGRPYHVLHSDRFDPTMNYPMVTEMAFICYQVTTKVNKKLAKWLKKKSKRFGGLLEVIRNQTVEFARSIGKAGIIAGHTHFAEDLHLEDVHYVNSGSWTEVPCSYLTTNTRGIELHHVSD
jgi:UDP-2,3-diacylglucosamine pyrophosphatase LpxH